MGLTKAALFTEEQQELAAVAKALGHPARMAILQYLIKTKACVNGDLVEEIGLAQATISQHLRELKKAGIVQGTVEGPRVNYCIDGKRWQELKDLFHDLFERFESPDPARCC